MPAQNLRLSDQQLNGVKPASKDYVLTDGDDLQLRVRSNGSAPRWIEVNDHVCDALWLAMQVSPAGSHNLIAPNVIYLNVLRKIIRPAQDILHAHNLKGFHELRAAFACGRYEQIAQHRCLHWRACISKSFKMELFLFEVLTGSHATRQRHIRQAKIIQAEIAERWQRETPWAWQRKHVIWFLEKRLARCSNATRYYYLLTLRLLARRFRKIMGMNMLGSALRSAI